MDEVSHHPTLTPSPLTHFLTGVCPKPFVIEINSIPSACCLRSPNYFPLRLLSCPPPQSFSSFFLSYSRLHSPAPAAPALQSLPLGFVLDFLNRPSLCSSFLLCLFTISPTPGGGGGWVGGWGGWGRSCEGLQGPSQMCPWWLSLQCFLVRHDHS